MAMPLPLGEVQRVVAMANGNLALGASLVAIGFVNPQSIFWVFGGQYSSSVGVVDVGPIMTGRCLASDILYYSNTMMQPSTRIMPPSSTTRRRRDVFSKFFSIYVRSPQTVRTRYS
jgi:hypothetical protein